MYAPSAAGLVRVHRYYSFGRVIPAFTRFGLSAALATPGVRRLVSGKDELEIPFDKATFERILESISTQIEQRTWAAFQSAWHSRRLIVFSFGGRSRCTGVTHIAPGDEVTFHPTASGDTITVPRPIGTTQVGMWTLSTVSPLPPWHRPHPWNRDWLDTVLRDVRSIVGREFPSTVDTGEDLEPSHGDLTPWNLRLDSRDRPWLLDWEWAGWAPRHSDLLRFAIAHRSLETTDAHDLASWVSDHVPAEGIETAARYWLQHRIYRGLDDRITSERDPALVVEQRQGQVEADALRLLAGA